MIEIIRLNAKIGIYPHLLYSLFYFLLFINLSKLQHLFLRIIMIVLITFRRITSFNISLLTESSLSLILRGLYFSIMNFNNHFASKDYKKVYKIDLIR